MTDVMQSYNYNALYSYQQQARLQFGANQGYGGEQTEQSLGTSQGGEIPQIRGHVNVSMSHLSQEMPKLETDHPSSMDPMATYQAQQPTAAATAQPQPAPPSESLKVKKFYEHDEEEDTIIEEHFTKSFAPEARARLRQPAFPASFYAQSASPQRSSSTSGYNGSLSGSVSPSSSNPYAQAFPNQAVSQLYQQAATYHHTAATSPLATTNNGTTTTDATAWPYSAQQYQQAFQSQSQYQAATQATHTQPATSSSAAPSIHSHYHNQLSINYPFAQQQEQHHRTPAFAAGFPQY